MNIYRLQKKLRKGNVSTGVCQEFCPQWGGSARHPLDRLGRHPPPPAGRHCPWADIPRADTHPGQKPPWADTPRSDTTPPLGQTPYWAETPWPDTPSQQKATAVDGTHPTGMYSCFNVVAHCRKFHFTTRKKNATM